MQHVKEEKTIGEVKETTTDAAPSAEEAEVSSTTHDVNDSASTAHCVQMDVDVEQKKAAATTTVHLVEVHWYTVDDESWLTRQVLAKQPSICEAEDVKSVDKVHKRSKSWVHTDMIVVGDDGEACRGREWRCGDEGGRRARAA